MGEVPVGEDATNRARPAGETVAGRSTEHAALTEGSVTYDIRFYAQAPRDGTLMEIIVNVEAQNKYNPGYPLIKRGVYYVSRMISAQNGVDFKNGEYGKLKKVCSIWICLNAPKERRNSITRYTLREEQLVGNSVEAAKNYDSDIGGDDLPGRCAGAANGRAADAGCAAVVGVQGGREKADPGRRIRDSNERESGRGGGADVQFESGDCGKRHRSGHGKRHRSGHRKRHRSGHRKRHGSGHGKRHSPRCGKGRIQCHVGQPAGV